MGRGFENQHHCLKPLISLTVHFIAHSAEISVDTHTDRHTDQVP